MALHGAVLLPFVVEKILPLQVFVKTLIPPGASVNLNLQELHSPDAANSNGLAGASTGSTIVPSETTITATQSGKTAVGVYALQTISSLASLRQAITTTITETTTATDGKTEIEIAAAIVFAGGVSWFLASLVGDAAAGEVIEPPTTEPDHPNDSKCPDPAQKCSDCTGVGGMCTTGSASGCACQNIACPTSQPKCSDTTCADNAQNKCTASNKDCDCTPDEPCPDDIDTLDCSDCGGGGTGETCAGVSLPTLFRRFQTSD